LVGINRIANNVANRAVHPTGAICDLPIKNDFQAGVIATVHLKIASRLFQIYQAIQGKLVRPGINRERPAQRLVQTDDAEHDQTYKHGARLSHRKARTEDVIDRPSSCGLILYQKLRRKQQKNLTGITPAEG
jgi:hypothetical protein